MNNRKRYIEGNFSEEDEVASKIVREIRVLRDQVETLNKEIHNFKGDTL